MIFKLLLLVYVIILPAIMIPILDNPEVNLFVYYVFCILCTLIVSILLPLLEDIEKKGSLKVEFYKTKFATIIALFLAGSLCQQQIVMMIGETITPEGYAFGLFVIAAVLFFILGILLSILVFFCWILLWALCKIPSIKSKVEEYEKKYKQIIPWK